MKTHKEIHTMIQVASTSPTEESMLRILDILEALNERITDNERIAKTAAATAACLANGTQPD